MMPAQPFALRHAGLAGMAAAALLLFAAVMRPGPLAGLAPVDCWALTVLGVALLVLGHSVRAGATTFGLLAFFFLIGGGAQLYLTEPLWFPTMHLRPQGTGEWVMAGVLGAEVLVALLAFLRLGPGRLVGGAAARLGAGPLVLFLALGFAFSVPVLNYVWRGAAGAYLAHLVAGALLIVVHLVLLVAMSQVRSPFSRVHRLTPIAPAAFAVAGSLALGLFAFERLPHVEDEVAYLFQARTFAGGALTVPAPPSAAETGLGYYLLQVTDGRWFSTTLPGWPAALAIFVWLGVPWLLNPLLAGLSVLLAYDIALRKVGRDQADLVALMMASSPWLLAGAGSLMPHTFTLTLILFAWWMILRFQSNGRHGFRRLLLAGLAMGWVFAARPLDGVLVGGLTGLWLVLGAGKSPVKRALPYALGCLVGGGMLLVYNTHITGSPFILPLSQYLDSHWSPGANAYGFGPDIGPPGGWGMIDLWVGHSPLEAVLNTVNLLASLQLELLGWSVGSLALFYAFFLWQRDKRAFDWIMCAMIAAVIVVMGLYWFADSYYFGPRYWYVAAFPFLYLSVRGYDALRKRFAGGDEGSDAGVNRLDSMLIMSCLFGLLVFTPWRGVVKYYEYGNFYSVIRDANARGEFGQSVVLVEKNGNEGSAFILNDPWLSAPGPIFLRDWKKVPDAEIEAAFPGRTLLRYRPNWVPRVPIN